MGAVFPDVPSVKLPQQGGGLVAFDDTTDATATADKILQGYTAYANGQKLVGTASGGITPSGTISITQNGQVDVTNYATADVNVSGGGGGGVTLLGSAEFTVNTSTTSTQQVGTISCGAGAYTKDKMIWVHVRDKVGKRASRFYGSDLFFINTNAEKGSTLEFSTCGTLTLRCTSSNQYAIATTMAGVFGNKIQSDGTVIISSRYNSTYSLTVNSTYICEVYAVDCPSALFD